MLNLMVANAKNSKVKDRLVRMLNAQIENSVELGWKIEDIIVLANFPYLHCGVEAEQVELNDFCLTGTKMFAVRWKINRSLIPAGKGDAVIWAHDLDAWQNCAFSEPEFKDVGIAQYSNSKYNGGSLFWKCSAVDIIEEICTELESGQLQREEPTLNKVLKSDKFKGRVTVLNNTFNVGCSGYVVRAIKATKPIHVLHFHPDNRIAWETHALDRNQTGEVGITVRLERLIRRHYPKLAWKVVWKNKENKEQKREKTMQTLQKMEQLTGVTSVA